MVDMTAWAELRESLREALDALETAKELIPWEYAQFLRDRDPRALECLKKRFPIAWTGARCEVVEAELGDADAALIEMARMRVEAASPSGVWVLAGGPPCQAYSTAGRSRRKHDPSYAGDPRLRLYESFMKFVRMLCPPVVVFENVVGILSEANEIVRGQGKLSGWYRGKLGGSKALEGHAARTVRTVDIERYMFAAAFAQVKGRSPRLEEMPRCLWPNHANLDDIDGDSRPAFNDRFYVQAWGKPSSTVTAHIAKSGHHFIHPDTRQHRSLTLREAARLQTFPDDFVFMGTKTAQFRQVGNAVPPLLAQQIAQVVAKTLGVDSYGYFDSLEGEDSEEEADAPKLRGVDMFLDAIYEFTDGINGMFVKVAEGLDKLGAPR